MAEKNPEKYPIRMGQKWDDFEVNLLLKSIQQKKSISQIAEEHERTNGAITSRLRHLAADYHFRDKLPIDKICKLTSLSMETVQESIERFKNNNNKKSDMAEIISILKDINSNISKLTDQLSLLK